MKKIALALLIFTGGLGVARAGGSLDQVNVYPNPYRLSLGHSRILFDNLTTQFKLRIYSASGVLVREVEMDNSSGPYRWDVRNAAGEPIASGIYVYIVTNNLGDKKSGKIAVIR